MKDQLGEDAGAPWRGAQEQLGQGCARAVLGVSGWAAWHREHPKRSLPLLPVSQLRAGQNKVLGKSLPVPCLPRGVVDPASVPTWHSRGKQPGLPGHLVSVVQIAGEAKAQ